MKILNRLFEIIGAVIIIIGIFCTTLYVCHLLTYTPRPEYIGSYSLKSVIRNGNPEDGVYMAMLRREKYEFELELREDGTCGLTAYNKNFNPTGYVAEQNDGITSITIFYNNGQEFKATFEDGTLNLTFLTAETSYSGVNVVIVFEKDKP